MEGFISIWQENFKLNAAISGMTQDKLNAIEAYLEEAEGMPEAIPASSEAIIKDMEEYSSVSFSSSEKDWIARNIISIPLNGEEDIPEGFSFSDDEAEGRARLGLTREILLQPQRTLEIIIPSIESAIHALEDENPEQAMRLQFYASKLFLHCVIE